MGVYIKGMKIPPNCGFCNLLYHCTTHIGEEINLYIRNICRHPDCPLIEVTEPHGRIIDESEIKTVYGRELLKHNNGYTTAIHRIDFTDAPTVIEAEGE